MNEEQKQMIKALIENCNENMRISEDEFERLGWENMKDGLVYIQKGGKW